MNTEEIGYISKTHGLKGHVILRLNELTRIDEVAIKSVFLEINGSQVPYFIEECRPNNTGYILKLENIDVIDFKREILSDFTGALKDFANSLQSEDKNKLLSRQETADLCCV